MWKNAWVMAAALAFAPIHAAAAPLSHQDAAAGIKTEMARLQVVVLNVSRKGGNILMGLYDGKAYVNGKDDAAVKDVKVPATPDKTIITVDGIPPGTYAIKMMQDVNRNGKFDESWLGLPLEPYGFSNDARPLLSAPKFSATKFTLAPGDNIVTIHLQ